jgi:hypothetical protein
MDPLNPLEGYAGLALLNTALASWPIAIGVGIGGLRRQYFQSLLASRPIAIGVGIAVFRRQYFHSLVSILALINPINTTTICQDSKQPYAEH